MSQVMVSALRKQYELELTARTVSRISCGCPFLSLDQVTCFLLESWVLKFLSVRFLHWEANSTFLSCNWLTALTFFFLRRGVTSN